MQFLFFYTPELAAKCGLLSFETTGKPCFEQAYSQNSYFLFS